MPSGGPDVADALKADRSNVAPAPIRREYDLARGLLTVVPVKYWLEAG